MPTLIITLPVSVIVTPMLPSTRRNTGMTLSMSVKCGAQGRLYGSITSAEVAEQLKAQHGVAVDKRDIKCENIRAVGDVEIEVRLYKDISAKMVVHVEAAAVK